MENSNGFNLFIDLDDVLVESHGSMNADLVKAYGKEYDWANTVDAQKHYDAHLQELLAKHGERAKEALIKIQGIRNSHTTSSNFICIIIIISIFFNFIIFIKITI